MRPCNCYYGENCTKTTVCANEAIVEELEDRIELLEDALRDIINGIDLNAKYAAKAALGLLDE